MPNVAIEKAGFDAADDSRPTAVSHKIENPDDPYIRESIAVRRDCIDRDGEALLTAMWDRGMMHEPLYACCPACGCVYGLYTNQAFSSSLNSIHEAYLALVCFLEEEEQCPRHLRIEIAVKSRLHSEE